MTRIGSPQQIAPLGQFPGSIGDLTAALDQRAAAGLVLTGSDVQGLVEAARPLPAGELASLKQTVGQALDAPDGWKVDPQARQSFADFLQRPVETLPPAVQPSAEQLAATAQARVQQNQATLDQLHALAPQPDVGAEQQLGQHAKEPPATTYDGSKSGVFDLLRQLGAPDAEGAAPLSAQELQDKLTQAQGALHATAQTGAPADSEARAQEASQDLQRAGASLQQPGVAGSQQEIIEQLLELLIQLMLAYGMSPERADSALSQALGRAGGWGGPGGGYQGKAPAGRTPGGRWSQGSGGGAAPGTYKAENWTPVTDPAPKGFGVSAGDLGKIVPGLSGAKADSVAGHLNKAMHEAGITDRKEQAAFVAQLAHESGGFKYMEEIASGSAYEGRRDLGNTQPGDGTRYKGRGPIQLTGRANYREAGKALGLDLENNPAQAATPEVGFRTAAWYWKTRGCGQAARSGDFRAVTKKINGGYNGLADRTQYYNRALSVLGG